MKKKEVVSRIGLKTGLKKDIISRVLLAYKEIVFEELEQQHSIRIENIGTLRYVPSISRKGFNPVKQRPEIFKGRNKIKFVPSKGLDKRINPTEED